MRRILLNVSHLLVTPDILEITTISLIRSKRYVNPIALKAITWRYFAVYVGWIAVEALCVYFLYPETHGRTLEELSFCKYFQIDLTMTDIHCRIVFEDRSLADNVTAAVEKQIYYVERPGKQPVTYLEESIPYKRF